MKITSYFILLVLPTLVAAATISEYSDIPLGPPVRHKRTLESTAKVSSERDDNMKLTTDQRFRIDKNRPNLISEALTG